VTVRGISAEAKGIPVKGKKTAAVDREGAMLRGSIQSKSAV